MWQVKIKIRENRVKMEKWNQGSQKDPEERIVQSVLTYLKCTIV
jgi:hypothetical protein